MRPDALHERLAECMAIQARQQRRLHGFDRTPVALDLSDNTNQWGASPAALEVLRKHFRDTKKVLLNNDRE